MYKKVLYGKDARIKIMEGINKITDAVAVTLGPLGRNVVIARSDVIDYGVRSFPLHISKDGVTVARAFDIEDPFEKVGVMAVKEAAEKTVSQAGDGTTTTCVLLRAIVRSGMALIEGGANPMELKRGIDKAVECVVEGLKKMAIPIRGDVEKIRQIATVSANNDSGIGDLIAQAFEKIGEEGIIDIEASNGVNTEIKIADGYKFSKGWVSPLFVNRKEKQICEFENPYILLYEKRVTHHTQVQKALELTIQARRPILIICEDAEQEGLAILAMNNVEGRIQCCIVTAPDFGELRRESMEDIATITGGTYICDTKGVGIKEIKESYFGSAKKVVISKDETIIIDGEGSKDEINNLLDELRMNLAQAKNEDEQYPIEKRIAKLTGGVAVIQVGAATETEMKEKLDRFDDAVRATKAALAEGFLAGAGTAFLRTDIMIEKTATSDYGRGWVLINQSRTEPLYQICKNAGVDYDKILKEISPQKYNFGYNAKTDKIEDLVGSGIIDPVKVLRCSLQNAASAAGMILTSECIIADTIN